MKTIKLCIICAILFSVNLVQAQDENNKWALSFGINAVDINKGGFNDFGNMVKDYLGTSDWNVIPAISTVSVSRYMNYGLSVKVAGSLNKIDKVSGGDVDGLSFFALDAAAVYDLNNLFGQTAWWDPFVTFGVGGAWIDEDSAFTITPGWGFNSWFNDNIGIAFSSTYNSSAWTGGNFKSVDASSYFQHSLGVVFKFGGPSKQDSDGDGVADEKDMCPEAAGTKENGGCPDTDGDGVLDKDDLCLEAVGTKENGGCPDTDGDGVLDKDDLCPEAGGTAENKGCLDTDGDGVVDKDDECPDASGPLENKGCVWPDTDGDGVVDKDDACPDVAGPIENKGCVWPDADGDGVPDKDDKCPEVAGTVEKEGCPELTQEQVKKLGEFSKKIGFNSGQATFKSGVGKSLDKLAVKMNEYPTTNFVINGYTDSTGSESKNLDISKKRAKAVKDRLVKSGVDAARLKSQGFGIANPIATNKTAKGREANRRVEIIAK